MPDTVCQWDPTLKQDVRIQRALERLADRSKGVSMDPEKKAAWIAALRSGHYAQGSGYLRAEDRHCCLGVLADIEDPTAWERDPADNLWHWNDCTELLLTPITEDYFEIDDHAFQELANLNDLGFTFDQIADLIEEHL